jgi:hypothetical protein
VDPHAGSPLEARISRAVTTFSEGDVQSYMSLPRANPVSRFNRIYLRTSSARDVAKRSRQQCACSWLDQNRRGECDAGRCGACPSISFMCQPMSLMDKILGPLFICARPIKAGPCIRLIGSLDAHPNHLPTR